MTDQPRADPPRWDIIGYFLGLAIAIHAATDADPDLWGHIRFGLDKIAARGIVRTDSDSYLTGIDGDRRTWINHEWLAEVLFAASWKAGGSPGVIVLKTLIVLLIHAQSYRILLRGGFSAVSGGLILLAMAIPLEAGLRFARPQIFTIWLFLTACGWIADIEAGERRHGWGLPILFAFWANLHGGVLAGLVLISGWLASRWLSKRMGRDPIPSPTPSDEGRIALMVAGCWIACLFNPYGWRLLEFLIREATGPRPEIADWAPLDLRQWRNWSYPALLGIGLRVLIRPRAIRPTLLVPFAIAAIAPLAAVRHLPLFAMATLAFAARPAAERSQTLRRACRTRWPMVASWERSRGWSFCGLLLAALAFGREGGRIPHGRAGDAPMPAAAVDVLKRSGVSGGLAVHFDWGEYAIWHLAAANVKVSIDGRRETVYSQAAYQENLDWTRGVGAWDRLLQRPETRLALVAKTFPVCDLMRSRSDWILLHEDEGSALFARRDSREERAVRACLAAPRAGGAIDDAAFP